jgi:hypothetical protein
MKIKTDFTTNSSSSSFVCWGLSEDDIGDSDERKLKAFDIFLAECKRRLTEDSTNNYNAEYVTEMESLTEDDEKIEYVDNSGLDDELPIPLSRGGNPYDYSKLIGICPSTLEEKFPDVTFGNLRKIVADEINKVFGTNLTEKDISYYEEGWMDN